MMENMTVERIISATGGEFSGDVSLLQKEITFITTDSRMAAEGCLFAAIAGERYDGHDFMRSASESGAVCCLAEKRKPDNPPTVVVPSTNAALRRIASDYRAQFNIPVIGITGSVGKTSTKEMTAAVLRQGREVLWTEGNFNNELGVPLTLFRLQKIHEAAVIEMGISEAGEMRRLTEMVRPDIAVFTAIGDAHLEKLKSRRGVLLAKAEMLEGMPPGGTVFYNGDDELLREFDFGGKTVSFGIGENCDVRAVDLRQSGAEGTAFELVDGVRSLKAEIPAYGRHLVYAALAAGAVGIRLGLSDAEITRGIGAYKTVGHRARPFSTGYLTIIDDCYNSNPSSARMALESLRAMPGRKAAILGDMLELGREWREHHEALGRFAAECGMDMVIACGSLARSIYNGALRSGTMTTKAFYYETKEELIKALPGFIKKEDRVLVKASRGMKFEDIIDSLINIKED